MVEYCNRRIVGTLTNIAGCAAMSHDYKPHKENSLHTYKCIQLNLKHCEWLVFFLSNYPACFVNVRFYYLMFPIWSDGKWLIMPTRTSRNHRFDLYFLREKWNNSTFRERELFSGGPSSGVESIKQFYLCMKYSRSPSFCCCLASALIAHTPLQPINKLHPHTVQPVQPVQR